MPHQPRHKGAKHAPTLDLLIACATSKELKAALKGLAEPPKLLPGKLATVQAAGRNLGLLVTGIGPVNAAMQLAFTLAGNSTAGVLNLGVAGSFDIERHPLGSLAVVKAEVWPEFGLATEEGVDPRGLAISMGHSAAGPVFERLALDPEAASREMDLTFDPDWPLAESLTVAGVTGSNSLARILVERHGVQLENMEGFAMGWTCQTAGVPFLEVRSVSNRVGSRDEGDWDMKLGLSALSRATARLLGVSSQDCRGGGQGI